MMNLLKYPQYLLFLGIMFFVSCQQKTVNQETDDNTAIAEVEVNSNCAFCGMNTQDHPKWRLQSFVGGEAQRFCSPKCFFMHYHQQNSQPDSIWAMDYYDLQLFNAGAGFFVIGSDILGPMGHDLVPFTSLEAAQEFAQDHAGKQILPFAEVDSTLVFGL